MKKAYIFLFLVAPIALFAQDASQPDFIDQVISMGLALAASIPVAGPFLAGLLKILGTVAVVLTSISAVLMALSQGLHIVGLSKIAEWIQKALPYIQKASMFNVQKKG